MHLARRNRDLPTNDRKGGSGCKIFPRLIDEIIGIFTPDADNCCQISAAPHSLRFMRTILLIILILLLIGAFPAWPYSSGWGYYPSGGIGLILLIVLILALTGRL
jgi:hypothetical protein